MNQRDTQQRREQSSHDDGSRYASGGERRSQGLYGDDRNDEQMGDYYGGPRRQMRSAGGDEVYGDEIGSTDGGLRDPGRSSGGYGDRYGDRHGDGHADHHADRDYREWRVERNKKSK